MSAPQAQTEKEKMEQAQTEHAQAKASGSSSGEPDAANESLFKSVTDVSQSVFELISSLGQLVTMEAALALQTIPRLIETRIATLFFAAVGWLSFGVLCSIAVFELTQWLLAAAATFFALQIFAILACQARAKKLHHRLSMPHTREALSKLRLGKRPGGE